MSTMTTKSNDNQMSEDGAPPMGGPLDQVMTETADMIRLKRSVMDQIATRREFLRAAAESGALTPEQVEWVNTVFPLRTRARKAS